MPDISRTSGILFLEFAGWCLFLKQCIHRYFRLYFVEIIFVLDGGVCAQEGCKN